MFKEIWKDIPGFEGRYQASNLGRIRSLLTDKIKNQFVNKKGYLAVSLFYGGRGTLTVITVHRLVMMAFHGVSKLHVNHKNGNKRDNRLINLEYVTNAENQNHKERFLNDRKRYGVYWNKNSEKWHSQIKFENHRCYLGRFNNKEDAYNVFYIAYSLCYGVAPWA